MTNIETATTRICVLLGSNQRTFVQLAGVNCNTARFNLPVAEGIFLNEVK